MSKFDQKEMLLPKMALFEQKAIFLTKNRPAKGQV